MSSTYRFSLSNDSRGALIVNAAGSLGLVGYAVREGLAAIKDFGSDVQVTANFVEVETIDGEVTRTITGISGDADDVTAVVKRKLAKERKEQAPAAESVQTASALTEAAPEDGDDF